MAKGDCSRAYVVVTRAIYGHLKEVCHVEEIVTKSFPDFSGGLSSSVPEQVRGGIERHLAGDWGDLDSESKAEADAGLLHGDMVLSQFNRVGESLPFYVCTESDRLTTKILLRNENDELVPLIDLPSEWVPCESAHAD